MDPLEQKLGTWPWEGPFEYGLDEPGVADGTRVVWEKTGLPKEQAIGQCVCVVSSMASFSAATGRGSPKAQGWMVDMEIIDDGFGYFYYHVEKRVPDQSSAYALAERLMKFVDSKTLMELERLPKSGHIQMSKFESLLRELGYGSGRYTAAFTHPDPMDPNDRKRQQTQSRDTEFPYDMPVSYGQPESPSMDGSKYQDGGYGGQLTPWFMPDDDGDIKKDEAIGTPYNFKQSDGGTMGGTRPPGGSRGFAGSTRDDLDLPDNEVFGEGDLRDLQAGELRDFMGSVVLQPPELAECFAVYNDSGDETLSLLERLDWDGDRY